MAYATPVLIEALRATALKLDSETTVYRWTHMGACNCGHLAQHLTPGCFAGSRLGSRAHGNVPIARGLLAPDDAPAAASTAGAAWGATSQ